MTREPVAVNSRVILSRMNKQKKKRTESSQARISRENNVLRQFDSDQNTHNSLWQKKIEKRRWRQNRAKNLL